MVILRCYSAKTRVACIREVQSTIKDSVRQLLVDKIEKFGLGAWFEVKRDEITAPNGSMIVFKGMQSYNAENIKSLEDFDVAWVEEAQAFSARSLRLLRPTIRKDGSEIWFSWNPRNEEDAVDRFFRGGTVPPSAIICPVGWQDNPWFPKVLEDEKNHDFAADPEMAEHVWGGGYEILSEGRYFARQMLQAERDERIGYFPHDPRRPVFTGWDIGVDDYTAIWFAQVWDGVPVFIDYYEASGLGAADILAEALPEYGSDKREAARRLIELDREPYRYEKHFYPPDIAVREWGAGAKTRVESLVNLGVPMSHIRRGPAESPADKIEAIRQMIPMARFNRTRRMDVGMNRLRRYSRKLNEASNTFVATPKHDENSHGVAAFGEFALACGLLPDAKPKWHPLTGHEDPAWYDIPEEPKPGYRIKLGR
jgi:phage terminase large subunit